MNRYNFEEHFERIVIDVAGPFPRSSLLIAMDYVTKQPQAYPSLNQEA
jgi:hypothetical protein